MRRTARIRVPLATEPDYIDAVLDICQRRRCAARRADDRRRAGAVRRGRGALCGQRHARGRLSQRDHGALQRQVRDLPPAAAHGIAAAASWLPSELPAEPTFPLFVKPRHGRGGVGAFPIRDCPGARLLPRLRRRSDRAGVSRRSRVHDRRALRLRRPAAVDRAPRARRDPRRRDRPRLHRPGSEADRAGRGVRARRCRSSAPSTSSAASSTARRSSSRSTRASRAAFR